MGDLIETLDGVGRFRSGAQPSHPPRFTWNSDLRQPVGCQEARLDADARAM